jgi:1-phosphatidylinositol phosphodiesterase
MFGEVLNECRAFLQKYPGECILMRVKEEYKPEKCTRSFQETFEDYYKANSDIISLISNVPYLDEIRGKIWIMRNFGYHEGYPWEASIIQDDYEINYLTEIKIKKEKIQNQLNNAINGYNHIIYINFCSGAGYLCWPFSTAKETNKVPMAFNGRLGIIVMDFPGEEAVGHLINLNY